MVARARRHWLVGIGHHRTGSGPDAGARRPPGLTLGDVAVPLQATAIGPAASGGPPPASTYREYAAPLQARVIACTWRGDAGWSRELRLLPDGCTDLVWDGSSVRVARASPAATWQPVSGRAPSVGVRLRPVWAGPVLGVPASDLAAVTSLRDIWPAGAVRELEERLAAAPGPWAARQILAAAAGRRACVAARPDSVVVAAARLLGDPDVTVSTVAARVGLSARQLRRRFAAEVGLAPRAFQAIARFQRFRRYLVSRPAGASLADAAAACGYADQAHLAHDCRRLAAATPSRLAEAARTGPG
jgi:AraC-like DNA-binding protein